MSLGFPKQLLPVPGDAAVTSSQSTQQLPQVPQISLKFYKLDINLSFSSAPRGSHEEQTNKQDITNLESYLKLIYLLFSEAQVVAEVLFVFQRPLI